MRLFEQSARVRASPWAAPCIVTCEPPPNYFPAQLAANCAPALQHKCAAANWALTKSAVMRYLSNGATAQIRCSVDICIIWYKYQNSVTKICLHYNICKWSKKSLSEIVLNTFANFTVREKCCHALFSCFCTCLCFCTC